MLRIHATNVTGLGSHRLVESLLPHLLDFAGSDSVVYLPQSSNLACIAREKAAAVTTKTRILPNSVSRLIEVTIGARQYRGAGHVLVLGDIPLQRISRQTVLVHSPFIIDATATEGILGRAKVASLQAVFAANAPYAKSFIVQTQSMKTGLIRRYGIAESRVRIIEQPPPETVRSANHVDTPPRVLLGRQRLKLFYPARFYPHKNHKILDWDMLDRLQNEVSEIVLTIAPENLPTAAHPLISCIGEVSIDRIIEEYKIADALLFLSRAESYGLPLLEAIWLNLPIVCPNLSYAQDVLHRNDYFFDINTRESLVSTIKMLRRDLSQGQQIDWSRRRDALPKNWRQVARQFIDEVYS
jgi:glycosyltransferase involved in cell wall biosynthesis